MTIYKFTGGTLAKSSEVNSNFKESLRATGQTLINQAEDRAITLPADGGIFVEAYVDADGQQDSVVTAETTASYITADSTYAAASQLNNATLTTNNPDGVSSPDNFFDNNSATSATRQINNTTYAETSLGKTFSSQLIYSVYVDLYWLVNGDTTTRSIYLQTYDGSIWTTVATLISNNYADYNYAGTYVLNQTVQGVRVVFATNGDTSSADHTHTFRVFQLFNTDSAIVTHTIPAGTFSPTISSSFLTFKPADWESGADVQYKYTNSVPEDSGWLDANEVETFTAFTSTPTKVTIKLIPKSSSPTAGYPSIKGIALIGTRP
jgi:hypothetical protein